MRCNSHRSEAVQVLGLRFERCRLNFQVSSRAVSLSFVASIWAQREFTIALLLDLLPQAPAAFRVKHAPVPGNVIIAAWVQQVDGSVLLYKPSFSATIFSTLKIAVELENAVSASYAMASNGLRR